MLSPCLSQRKKKGGPFPLQRLCGGLRGQEPAEELMFPVSRVHGHSDGAESSLLGPVEPEKETIQYAITSSRGQQEPGRQQQAVQKPSGPSSLPDHFGLCCIQLPSNKIFRSEGAFI